MPWRLLSILTLCLPLLLPAAGHAARGGVDWQGMAEARCGVHERGSIRAERQRRQCLDRGLYCRRLAVPRQTRRAQLDTWRDCMDGQAYRPR